MQKTCNHHSFSHCFCLCVSFVPSPRQILCPSSSQNFWPMGRKRVRAAERLARKKRVFSISKLHGSSGDAEIEERRERVLKKSRSLTFPPEVLSNYRLPSIRMRYGWDVSSGGHMGLLALHKRKLDVILNDLILRHLWPQAAGVLSVLLRAFFAEQDWDVRHTPHFWVCLFSSLFALNFALGICQNKP